MQFRSMVPTDLPTVAALSKAADPFGWTLRNFQDAIASGYLMTLVCDDVGAIVGYSVVMQVFDEAELLEIAVDPAYQGRGYGKALLAHTLELTKRRAALKMHLEVRVGNSRARAMYEKAGFVQVGLRKGYYPCDTGREDAVLMCLDRSAD
ncbi:MAG: ribosomal protein S18-alanine N-acetyltransferase [Duodenibacillus sp.]|nr:ribosomal protein S18-alanine N-acetyltransferase [Duodenibacillus sp.]